MTNRLLLALAGIAAVCVLSAVANGKPPAASTVTPDIAAVLAAGSDAQGYGIQNLDELTLNGIRGRDYYSATQMGLRQGVDIEASNGDLGDAAGNVQVNAGYGNGGTTAGAAITVQGGRPDGPGKVVIVTGDTAGQAGDCLMSDGAGHAVWSPCP